MFIDSENLLFSQVRWNTNLSWWHGRGHSRWGQVEVNRARLSDANARLYFQGSWLRYLWFAKGHWFHHESAAAIRKVVVLHSSFLLSSFWWLYVQSTFILNGILADFWALWTAVLISRRALAWTFTKLVHLLSTTSYWISFLRCFCCRYSGVGWFNIKFLNNCPTLLLLNYRRLDRLFYYFLLLLLIHYFNSYGRSLSFELMTQLRLLLILYGWRLSVRITDSVVVVIIVVYWRWCVSFTFGLHLTQRLHSSWRDNGLVPTFNCWICCETLTLASTAADVWRQFFSIFGRALKIVLEGNQIVVYWILFISDGDTGLIGRQAPLCWFIWLLRFQSIQVSFWHWDRCRNLFCCSFHRQFVFFIQLLIIHFKN